MSLFDYSSSFDNLYVSSLCPISNVLTPPYIDFCDESSCSMSVTYDDPCSPLFYCRPPPLPLISAFCYTQDLLQLEACRSSREQVLPGHARIIMTPLMVAAWEQALRRHPDRPFCDYIVRGILEGFHV